MDLAKYFGTFVAKGTEVSGKVAAISSLKLEYLTTLGIAAIVIFLGHAIVKRSKLLQKYAIPAPVLSGLIVSIVISCIKASGAIAITFDTKIMQDLCQNLFFLCVGFGFSTKLIKHAGGKLCAMIAIAACLLIVIEDVVGVAVGSAIGLNPLLALQCSSASMAGGVGTASAFGPVFEKMGAAGATTVGVAAGTMGNIMGSLIGGPVAAFLISHHNLHSDPNDKPDSEANGVVNKLDNNRMVSMFAIDRKSVV